MHEATAMPVYALPISIAAAFACAIALWGFLFADRHDFWEAIKYLFIPDIVSLFRGEWEADMLATWKFYVWGGVSVLVGVLTWFSFTPSPATKHPDAPPSQSAPAR